MSPFEPAGEVARWKTVYNLLVKADVGDLVSYEAMAEALGMDAEADRHKIQVVMRRAARELLVIDLRSVEAITNQGYRVIATERKPELARRQQARAQRAVRRGRDQITYADLSGVDDSTRAVFEAMAWKFAEQDEVIRRLDVRQARQERQLKAAASATQQNSEQIAALREQLARTDARLEELARQDEEADAKAAAKS